MNGYKKTESSLFFSTYRLIIKPLTWVDLPDFDTLQSDPRVYTFVGRPCNDKVEQSRGELEQIIQEYKNPLSERIIGGVFLRDSAVFIGTCAIYLNKEGEHELGYRILPDYWGQRYASEIIRPLIHFGFCELGLTALYAYVFDDHATSIKILEKGGMRLDRRFYNEEFNRMDRYYSIKK
jgi:[ribosomal protein S5]-alanine N-acetyltransferase